MKTRFDNIWNQYHTEVCRFICYRVQSLADAEDLLQDVFTRAYTHQHQLRDQDKVRGWLYGIARHAVIDHYRTRRDRDVPLEAVEHRLQDEAHHPERAFDVTCQLAACVRSIIADLPGKYREAVTAAELQDIPQTELAAQLGLSYSGTKSRVQRGRDQLRERLWAECRALLLAHPSLDFDKYRCCPA